MNGKVMQQLYDVEVLYSTGWGARALCLSRNAAEARAKEERALIARCRKRGPILSYTDVRVVPAGGGR